MSNSCVYCEGSGYIMRQSDKAMVKCVCQHTEQPMSPEEVHKVAKAIWSPDFDEPKEQPVGCTKCIPLEFVAKDSGGILWGMINCQYENQYGGFLTLNTPSEIKGAFAREGIALVRESVALAAEQEESITRILNAVKHSPWYSVEKALADLLPYLRKGYEDAK